MKADKILCHVEVLADPFNEDRVLIYFLDGLLMDMKVVAEERDY